jgi:hypothetical protein
MKKWLVKREDEEVNGRPWRKGAANERQYVSHTVA